MVVLRSCMSTLFAHCEVLAAKLLQAHHVMGIEATHARCCWLAGDGKRPSDRRCKRGKSTVGSTDLAQRLKGLITLRIPGT